jgi:DNA-directed RNA polymerase specialized sigma24 family protein
MNEVEKNQGERMNTLKAYLSKVITTDNVQRIGEMMAVCAFKPFLRYADTVFGRLYKGLVCDIKSKNKLGHTLSDGYDIAQEAMCFLCEHIGKRLCDELYIDKRDKIVTVMLACFRTLNRSLNKMLSNTKRSVCIDSVYESKITAQFEADTTECVEEDLTAVNNTIEQLKLTDRQKDILLCTMDASSYSDAARIMDINKATIWVIITRIRKKYIRIFSEPQWRTSR